MQIQKCFKGFMQYKSYVAWKEQQERKTSKQVIKIRKGLEQLEDHLEKKLIDLMEDPQEARVVRV